jgi:hypothetical protein
MRYIFIAILICFRLNLAAQQLSVDNSDFFCQIAPLYEFKQSILSLTFDDGSVNQFKIELPILKEKELPATYYVITDLVDSLIKNIILNNLSKNIEIGSHTKSHPDLIKIGNEAAKKELVDSKSFLQNNFGLNEGLTMSYPWGIYDKSVEELVKENYIAARSTAEGENSLYKLDRYGLLTHGFDQNTDISKANSWVDNAIQNHLWLIEMIHGISHVGYSPVDSIVLEEHLNYIKKVEDKIWCSTVSNVIKYLDESKSTQVRCELYNDTILKIRVNDYLDDSLYDQQLSLRIKVPSNWDNIRLSNGEKIKTEYYNKSKFIIFNTLPDNQLLTIRPGIVSESMKETGLRLVYLSSNPFLDNIRLSLEALNQQNIDISLCDMSGKILIHQEEKNAVGVVNLFFNTSHLSNGLYLLRVSSNYSGLIIKKLMKI